MAARVCFVFHSPLLTSTVVFVLLVLAGEWTVDAGATLKLQMLRYENPSAKDYGGSCCDVFCWSDCDHYFKFSLDLGNSDNNPKGSHYWTHTTSHYQDQNSNSFNGNMKGVNNPIVTRFGRWPSIGVKLKVFVWDEDGVWSSDDNVDGLVQPLRLTPARSASVASWTKIAIRGLRSSHKTTLRLQYMLYCDANYYGSDCSVYCVASDSNSGGHYTCDPATGSIICRPGWENVRTRCKTPSDDCLRHSCRNGATCVDGDRSYTCRCAPGYTGRYCEVNLDDCASRPCLNGGTCTDMVASYRCTCHPAYIGRTCATPYCAANNPCHNGGTCYGAGLCHCPVGFIGADCSIDLCQMVTCHNGGSCINGTCVCPPGVAGSTCDVDNCDQTVCLNGGICQEGVCTCPSGFTGKSCETNIDECASNPCLNNGTCYDLVNGYRCSCTSEYVGRTCSDRYCDANNPCRNGAICHSTGLCVCPTGFIGADCSIDRCDLLDCQNGGSCVDGLCVCPSGVIGANCDIDLCHIIKCMNGGNCSGGKCTCRPGFTGDSCETNIDDCADDPCENYGTCIDQENGFTCRCVPGFAGKLCSETGPPAINPLRSTCECYETIEDQPDEQMDPLDIWFYTAFGVIFKLLLIIVILSICLCRKRRLKMDFANDRPPLQPAPERLEIVEERAVANDYCSVKKHHKETTKDLDNDYDDKADDPLYERISGETSSDSSTPVTPEPQIKGACKDLDDPELISSSYL